MLFMLRFWTLEVIEKISFFKISDLWLDKINKTRFKFYVILVMVANPPSDNKRTRISI